jgi:hypothetical protein
MLSPNDQPDPLEREVVMKIKPEEELTDLSLDDCLGIREPLRPTQCPQCRAEIVKRIVYGYPAEEDPTPVEERDYVLGGDTVDLDSPRWYCAACRHQW